MSDAATILAVASPPGRSMRGIIRLSGRDTHSLLNHHLRFPSRKEAGPDEGVRALRSRPHAEEGPDRRRDRSPSSLRAAASRFTLNQFALPVTALLYCGPRSYTGEDAAELQMPGNPVLLERVIDALLDTAAKVNLDARRAEPGEFTARAFLNGKLDLIEAEGVAATIAARSDAELRAARLLTSGGLGALITKLADQLAASLALVEAGIDFTDQEDVVAISPNDLAARIDALLGSLRDILDRAVGAEQLEAIPWVVLVGEPNAGKSTLFNALLGRERAVISPIAGTTRDILAEPLHIETTHGDAEVMLVDLAGLDESADAMNVQMQRAAREAITRAELILRCVPIIENRWKPLASSPPSSELLVRTKSDLLPLPRCDEESRGEGASILVSATTHHGLDNLKSQISNHLADRAVSLAADALALRPRHEHALRAAQSHLEEAANLIRSQRTLRALAQPELIAAAMRAALDELGSLTGRISPDEVLGRIFATFCVGK